ncbi:rhodanese-like domain-containing protein [Dokdonia sinensis]|uniref:Rhodanese-like domain-containing protein n=1 Tax=Dokdonia sinensis TaxID=2479847 RepID=A0A3M0GJT3_9FLAO|nr:rhodanese-like domain-containing protein [Dokdonia sinensis]RMB62892.1 rhodanese-like domain-containing protein [Dokdonia sinensis]
MGFLSSLFGNKTDAVQEFKSRGAVILDVRSKAEYDSGAIPGSKHIPLPHLNGKVEEIKKWNKPVITCCASGMRSASAAAVLRKNGVETMNGGGWFKLSQRLD